MKLEDFIKIEIRDGIGICWLDHQFEKMNIVSPEVIALFDELGPRITSDGAIQAVVLISRKPDFMAGADIRAFQIEQEGDFRPHQARGHEALMHIQESNKPFVAAIHGACVGLGTELSLACHGRIAASSSTTRMGLPEVQLGLLPGGGGTQRLPRLIGIQKALDMMLTGKQIDSYRAKKWGLVDDVVPQGKLLQAAMIMAHRLIEKPIERKSKLTLAEKVLQSSIGRGILFSQARKMAFKKSQGNYPAIPAIIDCVETGYKNGINAGYQKELELFEKLMLTPESAGLRSLFFAMADNKKNPYEGARNINTLAMIGAGFMGAGIAEVSAVSGISVILKDIKQEVIDLAYQQIWKSISRRLKRRSITKIQAEQQIGNVSGQLTYKNFTSADIVIEAVLEEMSLKKQIIEDIQEHGSDEVIFATNTSSLSVTEMAAHAQVPERVVGMHYFSPVPKMPLLEIIKTKQTAEWVVASCYQLGIRQKKTVIVVNDGPGFYVNRILSPYTNECLLMIDEGIAIDAIDKAMIKLGFPVGPISLLDEVGLDIAAHITDSFREFAAAKPGFVVSDAVVRMYQDGRSGKKNRMGFYRYDAKNKRRGVDTSAYQYFKGSGNQKINLTDIQNRGLYMMLNEAALCLQEGIITSPTDGDLGAVFGIGFLPFTGGPFKFMDHLGVVQVVQRLNKLKDAYGERFSPAPILTTMVAEGKNFYEP